ncbi:MAG TPA: FeoA family protein [Syntrophomonadaceae bacterium]|nr:FeoA family protein [Syntrophomonadaceae bacterium]
MAKLLSELGLGKNARIVKVNGNGAVRRRMIDMGIVPGMEVKMERFAPLGDPLQIKLKGCHLSLRKEEAETVLVEEIRGQAK